VTSMLFFKGHDTTPHKAVCHALSQAADVLMDYPSLLVELKDMQQMGPFWDAHIRVLAVQKAQTDASSGKGGGQKGSPAHDYDPKNPEHALSDNPDARKPKWMGKTEPEAAFRFCHAAHAGELPDIPLQEMWLDSYELARASEPELKKIIEDLKQAHDHAFELASPHPDQ